MERRATSDIKTSRRMLNNFLIINAITLNGSTIGRKVEFNTLKIVSSCSFFPWSVKGNKMKKRTNHGIHTDKVNVGKFVEILLLNSNHRRIHRENLIKFPCCNTNNNIFDTKFSQPHSKRPKEKSYYCSPKSVSSKERKKIIDFLPMDFCLECGRHTKKCGVRVAK